MEQLLNIGLNLGKNTIVSALYRGSERAVHQYRCRSPNERDHGRSRFKYGYGGVLRSVLGVVSIHL